VALNGILQNNYTGIFHINLCGHLDADQWRTQEFCSGGFIKFSWRQRTERTGIWGR